jgi:hypothetical protein
MLYCVFISLIIVIGSIIYLYLQLDKMSDCVASSSQKMFRVHLISTPELGRCIDKMSNSSDKSAFLLQIPECTNYVYIPTSIDSPSFFETVYSYLTCIPTVSSLPKVSGDVCKIFSGYHSSTTSIFQHIHLKGIHDSTKVGLSVDQYKLFQKLIHGIDNLSADADSVGDSSDVVPPS